MFSVQKLNTQNSDIWSTTFAAGWQDVWTIGNLNLLIGERIGIFCSSMCPGENILRAYELARSLRDHEFVFIGGFHSPMEKEILRLLLRGRCRVVLCPSRAIHRIRLSTELRSAVEKNKLLVASPFADSVRSGSSLTAEKRNQFVASLASNSLIVHASAGGKIEALAIELLKAHHPLWVLDQSNEELRNRGALLVEDFSAWCDLAKEPKKC